MPRNPDGTFTRFNNQYSGTDVWQQDLATDKKIIALRHDVHDEDLAQGIAECLPKDGLEPMLGSLRMGAQQIIDMANGFNPTDGATFGQCVSTMYFNNTTRVLTLGRTGMTDMGETIPTLGDGEIIEVGVNELIAGAGLAMLSGEDRVNPANPKDTIQLSPIGTVLAGEYLNANVTVDQYGRINFISSGVPADTTFSIASATVDTTFTVDGLPQLLTPAIATGEVGEKAGGMSAAQAKQLADIVAGVGTNLSIGAHDQNQLQLVSSTETVPMITFPIADSLQAGLITAATFDIIAAGAVGEPDQALSLGNVTASLMNVRLSLTAGGFSEVGLPLASLVDAGLMSPTQFKQVDGLLVSGNSTAPMEISFPNQYLNRLTDHTGVNIDLEHWDNNKAGLMVADVTNVVPVGVGSTVSGYMWLVY